MNDLWDKPIETIQDIQTNTVDPNKFAQMPTGPQNMMFGPPGMMNQMFMPPPHANLNTQVLAPKEEVAKTEEIEENKGEVQKEHTDELKQTAGSLANDLMSIPNQKIQNSEFVSFLNKLGTGAYEIDKEGLKENPEKIAEYELAAAKQKAMEEAYSQAQADQFIEESKDPERVFNMQDALKSDEVEQKFEEDTHQEFDPTNLFKDVWDAGDMNEDELQTMLANWKEHAQKNMDMYNETIKEQPVETTIKVEKKDLFKFDENNPYIEHEDAYKLACELNEDLKVHDAILALQAHLQKHPDHAQSWRLLGQLYQENDEDDKAIAYFQKAYDLDPYDLESLLCLGVSCTNELQESVAMGHLLNWLKYNPEYYDLPFPEAGIANINQLRDTLKNLFLMAHDKNPSDLNVMV